MRTTQNTPQKINPPKRTKEKPKKPVKTKGWSSARRIAQAHRLRRSRIWLKSTGPRTPEGKKRASMNARKNEKSTAWLSVANAFLRAQNDYRRAVLDWHRMRVPKLASKATISAVFDGQNSHRNLGFLLGVWGRKLLVSGIQILEENNG